MFRMSRIGSQINHQKFVTSHERKLAEKFLCRVERVINSHTDIETINMILKQLNLGNIITRDPSFNDFLLRVVAQPVDMTVLLEKIRNDLLNQDVICKLFATIEIRQLVSDEELNSYRADLQKQINILYLFEAFNIMMLNSATLAEDVYQHVIKRRGVSHPGNPYSNFFFGMQSSTSLFERLKVISIDPGMLNFIFHRQNNNKNESSADAEKFIKKNNLISWNAFNVSAAKIDVLSTDNIACMTVNILEAAWEEYESHSDKNGKRENVAAAFGLIGVMEYKKCKSTYKMQSTILPTNVQVDDSNNYPLIQGLQIDTVPKKTSLFQLPGEWRDLYNAWNLHFIITTFDNLFLPIKILIPSVFSAQPDNFKEARMLALFLFANLYVSEQVSRNHFFKSVVHFKKSAEILNVWGQINESYAGFLIQALCPGMKETPAELADQILGQYPTMNLFIQFYQYYQKTNDFRLFYSDELKDHHLPAAIIRRNQLFAID